MDNKIINHNKLVILKEQPTYYDDIQFYLKSVKEATDSNNKINWNKIAYPPNIYKNTDTKKARNKKTENFRLKCKKYKLDKNNNLLYHIAYIFF